MSKILVLANFSGGLYDFRNEVLLELLKKHEVYVSIPDEVRRKELEEEGCHIVHTPLNRRGMNPLEDIGLMMRYNKILNEIKPDLVMTYTIKPNIYGGFICRMKKLSYITTITGLGSTFQGTGLMKKLIVLMYKGALKGASCIFFQNMQNKSIFEENKICGKKSVLVNGSGVNLQRHQLEPYPQEEQIRFLFVGRIMKEKGIEEFLDAAKMLHAENLVFEILGGCDEDYQEKLNEYETKGLIRYHGFQKDVKPFLHKASALVLPTYHEGMSNVLMEASATGRPVIATKISGCKEIFEEGVTGFGCEPQSSQSLIEAMDKFLALSKEERAQMGRNARAKMEREFDRRQIVDVYIKEIENLV